MSTGHKLGELARMVAGTLCGDPDLVIKGIRGYQTAGPEEITFAADKKVLAKVAEESNAGAVIVPADGSLDKPHIKVANPRLAFAQLLAVFAPQYPRPAGVHPTAMVGADVELGADCSIGAHVVIEDGAKLGNRVTLYPGVYVGHDVAIGDDCTLYPNVVIMAGCVLGNRVVIHAGTVIGSDGFGYVQEASGHTKVPQIGNVIISDDVEIGANVTVDRATCDSTIIGRGTKIDNLVQLGHNVVIGEHCLLVSMVGIAGSTEVGDNVVIAGQAGAVGHIQIGSGSRILARAMVTNDLPPGSLVSGAPAQRHQDALRITAATRRLPELLSTVKELGRRIEELEKNLDSVVRRSGSGATD